MLNAHVWLTKCNKSHNYFRTPLIIPSLRSNTAMSSVYLYLGLGCGGIQSMIHDSILAADIDTRKHLYVNIILSGGTMTCPGK